MPQPKHILVIRLSAMGDVAMTVPVLACLQKANPDIRITVLTRKFFAPIFRQLPQVEVYEADVNGRHKGLKGLKRLSDELRRKNIDAVADLHNVLRSNILKRFFKFSGIPVKQVKKGRAQKKALTRSHNKEFLPLKSTHRRYAEVFEALGFQLDLAEFECLEKMKLSPKLSKELGNQPVQWVGVAPFAQHPSKIYPLKLMEQVLGKLNELPGLRIFLFGGPDEASVLEEWESAFSQVKNIAGKISFSEELALISNLDLMVSMDSGNGHLAANYGVPVITLWGLTHPYAGFAPFRQPPELQLLTDRKLYPLIPTSVYGNVVPSGYENAMKTISPTSVVKKVKEALNLPQ